MKNLFEENVAVRVRDGTILRANIFRPDTPEKLPALVERTPYGKAGSQSGAECFAEAGYIYISQDSRGQHVSDGKWIPFTEPNTGDAEDGYDTVEWTATQPWCNGKVGVLGASYNAWMAWMLAKLQPPHLVAMAARSIPPEITELDWPGAFKPARRVHWWLITMATDLRRRQGLPPLQWDNRYLNLLPWSKIVEELPPGLAEYVEAFLKQPGRRAWRFAEAHSQITVPNFDISGWYDHCNGSIYHLPGLQRNAATELARTHSQLIIGPWNHTGLGQRKQGEIDFGSSGALDVNAAIIRWFDHWLKGAANGIPEEKPVRYFVMGAGEWKTATSWPPKSTPMILHLHTGILSPEPGSNNLCDRYRCDPADPVPTLWSATLFTEPPDRRKIEHRRDILFYLTPPLPGDVEIAGNPEVILHASSSAPDTDFFARLVDDNPTGRAVEISYGMVRARHRHGLDREELLEPGKVTEFRIRLSPTACRFKRSHRIRLEITSSDFPCHDRNHNVGRNDLFDSELAVADQAIFHSSRLILPLSP